MIPHYLLITHSFLYTLLSREIYVKAAFSFYIKQTIDLQKKVKFLKVNSLRQYLQTDKRT